MSGEFIGSTSIRRIRGDDRLTTLPIGRKDIYELYTKMKSMYWTDQEIIMSTDKLEWDSNRISVNMKRLIKYVLGFFAISDGLVNENLGINFLQEVPILEVNYFYRFQQMMEDIHAATYSKMIDSLITNDNEKKEVFNCVISMSAVKMKADWIRKWMDPSKNSFEERLIAFAVVEGIFFSGSFCVIYWLKSLNLLPGLAQANELIARDEGIHVEHAILLYHLCSKKCDTKRVLSLLRESVEIEYEFMKEAMPEDLPRMNVMLMHTHIKHITNRLACNLDLPLLPYPEVENTPFSFEQMRDIPNMTNFFDAQVTEYQREGGHHDVSMNDDSDDDRI